MQKQQIFNIEKEELTASITKMTLENLNTIIEDIQVHIDLLKCLSRAVYKNINEEDEVLPSDKQEIIEPVPKFTISEGWEENGRHYIGKFHRRLRGGIVGQIFVPESIVRKLEIESLDWVKASVLNYGYNQDKERHDYTLISKHEDYDANSLAEVNRRQVIKYGIVGYEKSIKQYIIRENSSDSLLKISIVDSDVEKFRIQIGDVVEYAYWKEDVLNGRVVWKHSQDSIGRQAATLIPKKIRKSAEKRILKHIFQDHTICIIGGDNKSLYKGLKEEVERRKGVYVYCTGNEPKKTLESKLKKSDCIIVFTEGISHDCMYFTKEVCKKNLIPVSYTKNLGNTQFVRRISILINKNNKDVEK